MTTRTTTMTKTMKTTIRLAALCMLLCVGTSFGGVRSSDVVNTDWLDLVRRYTSADEVSYEGSKWDNLVSSYSGTKPVNPLAEWWGAFGDERLTQLVELAFTNNKDMAVARARVLEARAQVGVTLAGMSPKADGGGV